MILRLFRRTPRTSSIAGLYGMIVAQARTPAFYRHYGVPDTVNGRFEMIALHTVLLLRRLAEAPLPLRRLGQEVFDRFCEDMDASMREMGVGDLAVPRKMRRVGAAFYARQAEYGEALASGGFERLEAVLAQNVFGGTSASPEGVECLARYVRAAANALAAQNNEAIARSELRFPDPAQVSPALGACSDPMA
jgi:cytochrome b pre-mRNA-processing protein 3